MTAKNWSSGNHCVVFGCSSHWKKETTVRINMLCASPDAEFLWLWTLQVASFSCWRRETTSMACKLKQEKLRTFRGYTRTNEPQQLRHRCSTSAMKERYAAYSYSNNDNISLINSTTQHFYLYCRSKYCGTESRSNMAIKKEYKKGTRRPVSIVWCKSCI